MKEKFIELHLHLDGAMNKEMARKLAKMAGITLPVSDEELEGRLSVSKDCQSLNEFLKCFDLPLSFLQEKELIKEAFYLVQEEIKKQGVIYAEIRFAPQLHCQYGLTQKEVILAALEGLKSSDLACNIILCCMRGIDNHKENLETIALAKEFLVEDGGVVAVDLAGAEALFPTEGFSKEFALAREYKLPFTIHAGEADGADSVRKALEFGARRIGHGVRAREDESLLHTLREKQTCLELCPTSNIVTKAVEKEENYPLREYLNLGLCVTINTDDMAILRTNLPQEFDFIRKRYNITEEEVLLLKRNAIKSAFTTKDRKEELLRQLK